MSDEKEYTTSQLKVMSVMTDRLQLAQLAGIQQDGKRDLYEVFGYKRLLKPEDLLAKYNRQDIASRIVDAPPGATWSRPPTIEEEGDLKNKWDELLEQPGLKLRNAMYRADRLARLNQFSLLILGFDDTGNLKTPVGKATELLYVRPASSRNVTKIKYNTNTRDARYGMPETYTVRAEDPSTKTGANQPTEVIETTTLKDLEIHWTRCVHIVEYPLEDPVFGTPILEKCFNLLDDLLKVAGGTSEMYWLTGNRGLHANIDSEMEIDPADALALSDEIEDYQNQLRRVIRTRGVDLKVLSSTTPNPKETFEMIMSVLSGTSGIPRRILLGSEAGQLASEQDRANWAERIEERRILFVNPEILDPTVMRLQNASLLPEGTPEWYWPSAFIQNPLEEGQTMAQIARAVGNLSRQTGASTPMQLLSEEECRSVLLPLIKLMTPKIADADRYELPEYLEEPEPAPDEGGDDVSGKPGKPGAKGKETDDAKAKRAEKKDDNARSDNK